MITVEHIGQILCLKPIGKFTQDLYTSPLEDIVVSKLSLINFSGSVDYVLS